MRLYLLPLGSSSSDLQHATQNRVMVIRHSVGAATSNAASRDAPTIHNDSTRWAYSWRFDGCFRTLYQLGSNVGPRQTILPDKSRHATFGKLPFRHTKSLLQKLYATIVLHNSYLTSWKSYSRSASQEIPRLLWYLNAHYCEPAYGLYTQSDQSIP